MERGIIGTLIVDLSTNVQAEQEELILRAFEKKGFTFETNEEMEIFFKTSVHSVQSNGVISDVTVLYVGDIPICSYGNVLSDDTYTERIKFEFEFTEL